MSEPLRCLYTDYVQVISNDFAVRAVLFVPLLALLIGAYIYVRRSLPPADGRAIKLQESVRGLIHGTKEFKLSKVKKDWYFDEVLLASEHGVLNNSKIANTIVSAAATYGEVR